MNLEQEIHAFIVRKAGGNQKDVKGVSQTTLTKMKRGKSGMSTKKLSQVLKDNEIDGTLNLESENTKVTIKLF